jgi:hypothetical protein
MAYDENAFDIWDMPIGGASFRRHMKKHGPKAGWVFPEQSWNKTKEQSPYGYTDFYHWRTFEVGGSKGHQAVYSDRLSQWDHNAYERAWSLNKQRFEFYSQEDCSKFLTEYFGKPIIATALSEGCNPSNGYPYYVFYFQEPSKEAENTDG